MNLNHRVATRKSHEDNCNTCLHIIFNERKMSGLQTIVTPTSIVCFDMTLEGINVVFCGDRGTGKSSIIHAIITERFAEGLSTVLETWEMPPDFETGSIALSLIDTSRT